MARSRRDSDFVGWWLDVNTRFGNCVTSDDLFAQVEQEIRALDFDCFAYGYRRPVPFNQIEGRVEGSYPAEWLSHYEDRCYGEIDPSVVMAREIGFVIWTDHREMMDSPIFCEAREWGLNIGATFMMRGRDQTAHAIGVSRRSGSVSANEALLLRLKISNIMASLEDYIHPVDIVAASNIKLSCRELEILRWIGDGKCSQDVSCILGISENTVNFHVKGIQRKFGSSNRVLAAAYAAALGLI
jgi:LuxR family transcriptional activator of rhlAB and lasB